MRKLMPIVTAAALAALLVGGVSAASGSHRGSDRRDFTALDVTQTDTQVDVDNSNSFTLGDEDIATDVLKNPAGTRTIGSLSSVCTVTEVVSDQEATFNATFDCVAAAKLRGGTLEAAGSLTFTANGPMPARVAITGGTGRYDEAHGQVSLRFLNDTDTLLHFDID